MTDVPPRVREALEYECPRCKAPAGIGCTRPTGSHLASHTVHKAREEAAALVKHDDGPPTVIVTNQGRLAWRDQLATLKSRGDINPTNLRVLLSAIRWQEVAEASLARAEEAPEVVGSTGQAVANPQYTVAARASERSLSAYRALMLLPDSRIGAAGGPGGVQDGDDLDDLDREAAAGQATGRG